MDNEIYVTLLSNSSKNFFPENKTSDFTVHLSKEVNLEGKWRVALSEITFPSMIHNVSSENNGILIHYKSFEEEGEGLVTWKPLRIEIPFGSYTSITELIEMINSTARHYTGYEFNLLSLVKEKYIKITSDKVFENSLNETFSNAREAMLSPPNVSGVSLMQTIVEKPLIEENLEILHSDENGSSSQQGTYIEFEGRLALQLGFTPGTLLKLGEIAQDRPHITLGIPPEIFVYVCVVEPQLISDSSSQVVRIVNTHGDHKTPAGSVIVREFVHRNYLPLVKNRFQTIHVELRDTTGKYIPFNFGTSSATLHFKRSS